jgi:hypothetical protein
MTRVSCMCVSIDAPAGPRLPCVPQRCNVPEVPSPFPVAPSAPYEPPPVVLGPPPSYRSFFGNGGRKPPVELADVVASSSPRSRMPLLPTVPSPFRSPNTSLRGGRGSNKGVMGAEEQEPLLARVVDGYDMLPQQQPGLV